MLIHGEGLFSGDLANDIKLIYEDYLRYNRTPNEAEAAAHRELWDEEMLEDEKKIFWLALAATEWKCGRILSQEARDKALMIIEHELARHQQTKASTLIPVKQLLRLKEQLQLPLPKPRKLSKRLIFHCPWEIGDYLIIRLDQNHVIKYIERNYQAFGVLRYVGKLTRSPSRLCEEISEVPLLVPVLATFATPPENERELISFPYARHDDSDRLFKSEIVSMPIYCDLDRKAIKYAYELPFIQSNVQNNPLPIIPLEEQGLNQITAIDQLPYILPGWLNRSEPFM